MTTIVDDDLLERYFSYNKVIHVVAYLFRFSHNCRSKRSGHNKLVGSLNNAIEILS